MFIFRLGSRRQINYQMRDNGPSQSKFEAWFEVENIPHGDTLNYGFKKLDADEVQEVIPRGACYLSDGGAIDPQEGVVSLAVI